MVALKAHADDPEARLESVKVVNTETDFTIDPERDLLDYWGGLD
jgi:hypothetical protein